MSHPYDSLPEDRFWRTAVADRDALEITGLWKPRHQIGRRTGIVTAGSCFAQHFARALVARRYRWLDFEPGPAGLTAEQRKDYHYGTFSFRTGNIYTPRMLRQWLTWALTDAGSGRGLGEGRPVLRPVPSGGGTGGLCQLRTSFTPRAGKRWRRLRRRCGARRSSSSPWG
jgi:hypothetical protein